MKRHALIRSLENLAALRGRRIVCLASGGVDSSYVMLELSRAGATVVPVFVDTMGSGEGPTRFERICRALALEPIVVDRRARFVDEFVAPAIIAHAMYLGAHPISSSLSRPLFAQTGVEVASKVNASAIVHTATASQNSLRRFNCSIADLGFAGEFGSPFECSFLPRESMIAQLGALPVEVDWTEYSVDENAWARCVESGALDNPEYDWDDATAYKWTRLEGACPPVKVSIAFQRGVPTELDGVSRTLEDTIAVMNRLAGERGLGRYRTLEENGEGRKVQEFREAPAAMVLLEGFRRLESACLDAECIREKMAQEQLWIREAVEGRWFGPLRRAAGAFMAELAASVTGSVTFELAPQRLRFVSLQAEGGRYIKSREQSHQPGQ